jgi:hypothetical protein
MLVMREPLMEIADTFCSEADRPARKPLAWLSLVLLVPALAVAQEPPDRGDEPGQAVLDRAVAEADRIDPGWRFKDLEARRVRPPAARNSAELLAATRDRLSSATDEEKTALNIAIRDDAGRLDATAMAILAGFVARNRDVLPAVRSLVDRPTGRFALTIGKNWFEIPLPHLQPLREQVRLLAADALLRLDDGDADGALDSCRAALCAARSLIDEPAAISQLVRIACDASTQETICAVVARGRPSAAALAATQQLVADEVDQPMSLIAVRGERVIRFETLGHLADGTLSLNQALGITDPDKMSPDLVQEFLGHSGIPRAWQGITLERMTRMVEVVRKPSWTWYEGIEHYWRTTPTSLDDEARKKPEEIFPRLMLPSISPLIHGELRTDTLGRALVLLIAAKRHALAHGRWPSSAGALMPQFLAAVPTDPLTGRPMRLLMKGDELIAYSPGLDGRDDGGAVSGSSRREVEKSADVGFALSIHGAG